MSAPYSSRRFPVVTPGYILKYLLVLHRSPGVRLPDVVRALRHVTRFAEAEALTRMWDAHQCGRAVVLTTYLERGEFLAERLADWGLCVSLEVADR